MVKIIIKYIIIIILKIIYIYMPVPTKASLQLKKRLVVYFSFIPLFDHLFQCRGGDYTMSVYKGPVQHTVGVNG